MLIGRIMMVKRSLDLLEELSTMFMWQFNYHFLHKCSDKSHHKVRANVESCLYLLEGWICLNQAWALLGIWKVPSGGRAEIQNVFHIFIFNSMSHLGCALLYNPLTYIILHLQKSCPSAWFAMVRHSKQWPVYEHAALSYWETTQVLSGRICTGK